MSEPANYNRKEFVYRVGTFFLLVGLGLLIFFMLSESAKQPQFNYFCGSMVLLILGFLFRAQYRKPSIASGRFGGVKKLFRRGGGSRKRKEEDYDDEEYEDE